MTYYTTVDRCIESGCRCDDTQGVILYDGPDLRAAQEVMREARYPDPQIEERELVLERY